jgi:hypothetical protein
MRSLITTVALLTLLDSPAAIAQTIGSARSSAKPASPTALPSLTQDTIDRQRAGRPSPTARK